MAEVSFSARIDELKESFLWAAAQQGNTHDCESLIEIGADVNWKHQDGDTPLLAACRRGHTETIALLLAHGADSNICGTDSFTPLHVSTRRGDAESVNVLLNANTSTTARTKEGQTALDIARAKGYESIYARLMEKRSGVSRPTPGADASNMLINNVRNELPALLGTRPDSAGMNGSIAPASRKLQSLGRLIQQETTSVDNDRNKNSGSGSASRSRRHEKPNMASSSVDGMPAETWAGAESTGTSNSRKLDATSNITAERTQKTSSSSSAGPSNANFTISLSGKSAPTSVDVSSKNSAGRTGPPAVPPRTEAPAPSTTATTSNYSILGSAAMPGEETATIALRKILDQEKAARKQLEIKLTVFTDQNTQLLREFAKLTQQLTQSQDEFFELELQMNRLLGEPAALDSITIEECDEVERALKSSLERVEAKKAMLIRNKIENQKEQRMCVVCQEHEKSVVLLPCRHLCLCADCSTHDLLTMCPLCREKIVHKISVFS